MSEMQVNATAVEPQCFPFLNYPIVLSALKSELPSYKAPVEDITLILFNGERWLINQMSS